MPADEGRPQAAQAREEIKPSAVDQIKRELGINESEIRALVEAKDLIERRAILEDALRRVGIQTRKTQKGPHQEAVESAIDEGLNAIIEKLPIEEAKMELSKGGVERGLQEKGKKKK